MQCVIPAFRTLRVAKITEDKDKEELLIKKKKKKKGQRRIVRAEVGKAILLHYILLYQ